MYCLDLHSSYLALITTPFLNLLQLSSDPAQFQAADFLARENHVAYVASSCLLLQCRGAKEEGTKKCFPHTRTAAKPRGSPSPTLFFFQKWEVVRFCAKLRMAKIAFPLSRTTDFENGRHHCTKATIQWTPILNGLRR